MPPNCDYLPKATAESYTQRMVDVPDRPLADLVPPGRDRQTFLDSLAVKFKNVTIALLFVEKR